MKTDDRGSALQYAKALIQLTEKEGNEEVVFKNLATISGVFESQPEFFTLFRHPAIPSPVRKAALEEFSTELDRTSANLLLILCERRKMNLLPMIVEEFHNQLRAKHNIVSGTLISAADLSDEAVAAIKRRLSRNLKKHVELLLQKDESLIGGYMLKIGDQVIDGSLKGRLQSIEKALLSV